VTSKTLGHSLQPIVVPASIAHAEGYVSYDDTGTVRFRHPALEEAMGLPSVTVATRCQFPAIFATFMDLSRALSSQSNSPLSASNLTLREEFDEEFARYRELVSDASRAGKWEHDYGSYVFDHVAGQLYLIAPERWHRVALTTSTGTLLRDVDHRLSWREVRATLELATIGVVGASVGSNVVEALARELRPQRMKVADPDWIELNNLNRLERASLEHLVKPRSFRSAARSSMEMHRYGKADVAAYLQQRVDPYARYFVYPTGIDDTNLDRFLLGGGDEPALDLVVEETDDLGLKVRIRERCRELGIPVLMMTDFGHQAILHFQDFKRKPETTLGYACGDEECRALLDQAMTTGNREQVFELVRKLVGPECVRGEFSDWVAGLGEQPTSSLPQSGATAMISGGIAGKCVALYLLGHRLPERAIYDFASHTVIVDRRA
jgi:molybdopterin/thiamine biosynthesis adenylyltransferase